MQTSRVVARVQAAGAEGDRTRISGYGVAYGQLNDYNRVFVHGACSESLTEFDTKHPMPIGWMHDIPIGIFDTVEDRQQGPYLEGAISPTSVGNDASILIKDGLNALSVGFYPLVVQWAEPNERVSFDTPYGTRAYQFDTYATYIVKAELLECSFVFVGADDEARIDSVQSRIRQARELLPGVAAQASWEEAATSMARLLSGALELPELERHAFYTALTQTYRRHEKTPPAYSEGVDLAEISFQHDERALYAERSLRDQFAAITAHAGRLEHSLSPEARAEAEKTLESMQQLLARKTDDQLLADIEASLRETTQTLRPSKENTD